MGHAYLSPDMSWLVFQACDSPDGTYQIYLAQVRYNGDAISGIFSPIRITPTPSRNGCGYFSPDGISLIFSSTAGNESDADGARAGNNGSAGGSGGVGRRPVERFPRGMEIFRADGWQGAITGVDPGSAVDFARKPITFGNFYNSECAVSPDNKLVVFTSNRSGSPQVWVMHADGTHPVQLTQGPEEYGGAYFSPEGQRIVYRGNAAGSDAYEIYESDLAFDGVGEVAGLAGTRTLTHDDAVNFCPYWHPDGKHIVYATGMNGLPNFELYLMRADGSHKTRVTFNAAADMFPAFSADGKYLVWVSKRTADGKSQIFAAKFTMPTGN